MSATASTNEGADGSHDTGRLRIRKECLPYLEPEKAALEAEIEQTEARLRVLLSDPLPATAFDLAVKPTWVRG